MQERLPLRRLREEEWDGDEEDGDEEEGTAQRRGLCACAWIAPDDKHIIFSDDADINVVLYSLLLFYY